MSDQTLARDAMLTRMAMAIPGGPMFRDTRYEQRIAQIREIGEDTSLNPPFDEAQAYAASRKGLIAHTALMRVMADWAIEIRRRLDQGQTVVLSAGGEELARFEP